MDARMDRLGGSTGAASEADAPASAQPASSDLEGMSLQQLNDHLRKLRTEDNVLGVRISEDRRAIRDVENSANARQVTIDSIRMNIERSSEDRAVVRA